MKSRLSHWSMFLWAAGASVLLTGYSQIVSAQSVIKPNAIVFSVSDLQRSLRFYRDGLGFTVDKESAFPTSSKAVAALLGAPGAKVKAVTLDVPGTSLRLVLLHIGVRLHRATEYCPPRHGGASYSG